MPRPDQKAVVIRHAPYSTRPGERAKCSAWAKCLGDIGRLHSNPTPRSSCGFVQKSMAPASAVAGLENGFSSGAANCAITSRFARPSILS